MAGAGSSPLTRGKRGCVEAARSDAGLIPAHAGKTADRCRRPPARGAHPRSRGENRVQARRTLIRPGSSPLTRGKHQMKAFADTAASAHPRSRGENHRLDPCRPGDRGSSPLTRGKQPGEELSGRIRGLIPAHAGKTSPTCNGTPTTWAHPRSRGENPSMKFLNVSDLGSSPLTRGKRELTVYEYNMEGLIPAHAGKTLLLVLPSGAVQGSSPLTRGKLTRTSATTRPSGLIPAHAGKTTGQCGAREADRAHPRSRGENHGGGYMGGRRTGSSPLTRGKPILHRLDES